MARPTKPKDVKPKALEPVHDSGGAGKDGGSGLNLLIMAVIIILSSAISSAASIYFLAPMVLKPLIASIAPASGGEEGAGGEEGGEGAPAEPTVGPVLDLEEFTVNLKDRQAERYLRADLSITVTAEDPEFEKLSGEALHVWEEAFHLEMAHYVPAVRDIVISALTKRTSTELSTAMGKQELKDEIKRNVDGLFHGGRKVIRVNLENFIIQ